MYALIYYKTSYCFQSGTVVSDFASIRTHTHRHEKYFLKSKRVLVTLKSFVRAIDNNKQFQELRHFKALKNMSFFPILISEQSTESFPNLTKRALDFDFEFFSRGKL